MGVKDFRADPGVGSRAGIWDQIQNEKEGGSRHPRTGWVRGAPYMKEPINK